jgi:hypothetical protein
MTGYLNRDIKETGCEKSQTFAPLNHNPGSNMKMAKGSMRV